MQSKFRQVSKQNFISDTRIYNNKNAFFSYKKFFQIRTTTTIVTKMNFGFIFSFLSIRWLQVVVNGKSPLEYPVNAYAPQGSILSLTLFLLYINGISDDIMCNIAIHADGTTLYSKYSEFDQAFDLWQQLEFASELESDLQDTRLGQELGQEVVC